MLKPTLKALLLIGTVLLTSLSSPLVSAKGVYQSGPDFIAEAFNQPPNKATLWLTKDIREQAAEILGHSLSRIARALSSARQQDRLDSRRDWQRDAHYHWRSCRRG